MKLNKKNRNYVFLSLAGIITIALSLVIFKKDRFNEFSCIYDDGSGPIYVNIDNEHIIDGKSKIKIIKETSDKIIAKKYPDRKWASTYTFYKRTNKYKQDFGSEKTTFLLACTQLN